MSKPKSTSDLFEHKSKALQKIDDYLTSLMSPEIMEKPTSSAIG